MAFASKRLARTRRADHQHAFRDASAEPLKLFGVLEELDDLLDFFLGFLHAGDFLERHLVLVAAEHAGARFAEAHGAFAGHLDLADENEIQQDDKSHERRRREQQVHPELVGRLELERDLVIIEEPLDVVAPDNLGRKLAGLLRAVGLGLFVIALDGLDGVTAAVHRGLLDGTLLDQGAQLAVGRFPRRCPSGTPQLQEQGHHDQDDHPQENEPGGKSRIATVRRPFQPG
jgi:hypothetical protein